MHAARTLNGRFFLICSVVLVLSVLLGVVGCGGGREPAANRAPTITSLTANPNTVQTRGQSRLTCTAQDPDGDALAYGWTCSKGQITGSGAAVDWTAPNTAEVCTITCTVNDGKEKATATAQVNVTVEAPAVLGDWWCYAYQEVGDPGSQPFGPLDPWEFNGDFYEYVHITFNADGTFVDVYRFCGGQEQHIDGTWSYDAAGDAYVVDFGGGALSTVTVVGDSLMGVNMDGARHWYQRAENRYSCPTIDPTDPSGIYYMDELIFVGIGADDPWYRAEICIDEDKATGTILLDGTDDYGKYWAYNGSYTRTDNAIDAINMWHMDYGSEDMMDLHLTLNGDTLTGTAINHVPEGQYLTSQANVIATRYTTASSVRSRPTGGVGKAKRVR